MCGNYTQIYTFPQAKQAGILKLENAMNFSLYVSFKNSSNFQISVYNLPYRVYSFSGEENQVLGDLSIE
jgi:hypothetical protein